MGQVGRIATFVLALVVLAIADRGLELTTNTLPSHWQTRSDNTLENNRLNWNAAPDGNWYNGFYAALSVGSTTYFLTCRGIYSTTVGTFSSSTMSLTPFIVMSDTALNNMGCQYDGRLFRHDTGRMFWARGSAIGTRLTGSIVYSDPSDISGVVSDMSLSKTSTNKWGDTVYTFCVISTSTGSSVSAWSRRFTYTGGSSSWDNPSSQTTVTSNSRCFGLYRDSSLSRWFIACSGMVISASVGGDCIGGSRTEYPVGAGDFKTGLYITATKRLYLGSMLGLAFEVDVTTFAVTRVTLVITGSGLSPFRSVWLDSPNGSPGVLYWGTLDGIVARVNIRDFSTVFATSSLGYADDLATVYDAGSSSMLYYFTGVVNQGSSSVKNFTSYKLQLTDCSIYTCSSCLANPVDLDYCGWCQNTGTCTRASSCPSGPWLTSGICPVPVSLVPSSGATSGGTTVVYTGTFISQPPVGGAYYCRFGAFGDQPAVLSGGTRLTCESPPGTGTVTVTIRYKQPSQSIDREYSGGLQFTYYGCGVFTSCPSCHSATYPDCGWCFRTASCTGRSQCSNPTQPFEWQTATCPVAANVTALSGQSTSLDFHAPIVSAGNAQIAIGTRNWPTSITGGGLVCRFTEVGGGITADSALSTGTSGRVNCNLPAALTGGTPGDREFSIALIAPGDKQLAPAPSEKVQVFSCNALSSCFECNRHASTCNWCTNPTDKKCTSNPTCDPGYDLLDRCASLTAVTPTKVSITKLATTTLQFTGSDLDSADAQLTRCYFLKGGVLRTSTLAIASATQASCSIPTDLTDGTWQTSLGNNIVPQTQSADLVVFDCSALSSCDTCLSPIHPDCDWCIDLDTGGCADSTHEMSCSAQGWLSARGICPSISSIAPSTVPLSGGQIMLSGNLMLSAANYSGVSCSITDLELPITHTVPVVWSGGSVNCTAPAFAVTGTSTVSLRSTSTGTAYTSPVPLEYVTCGQFSDCESCINGRDFCHWCGAKCLDTCPSDKSAEVCPVIIDISPKVSITAGGELITIIGSGFLTTTAKRDFNAQADVELSTTSAKKSEKLSEDTNALLTAYNIDAKNNANSKRDVSPYSCDFGGVTTPATVDASGTHLYCETPVKAIGGPSILNVLYEGDVYLSTEGITFFKCDSPPADACNIPCLSSSDYCGWCVIDNTCGSLTQCRLAENTQTPAWQTGQCSTATLDHPLVPLSGELPVTITLSETIPPTARLEDLSCLIGDTSVPAVGLGIVTNTNGNETISASTVTCVPPSSSSARETTLSLTYRGSKYFSPVPLSYGDCGIYKSCTRCISVPFCGWCNKGNKCMMQVECPEGSWSKNKCPINKVAIGVGVGVGMFFFLLLLLLLLFLVRRYRRKAGLLIQLREPNYYEIAWGSDTVLGWKLPSDAYSLLERHLARKDFLLQVAISFNCPATEQDAIAKALIYVASSHGIAAEMIQTCIRYEIQACLSENTLFRNNSVASRMYKFFSRIVGIKYLFNCIARVIVELEELGKRQMTPGEEVKSRNEVSLLSMTMELDQTKALGDDIDTETNLLQLQLICQKLLTVLIKTSLKNIPAPFRKIFVEIDNSVMSKFASNDAVYKGIGGLFFLRFVCPAITAPHVYGLLETPPNTVTQRQLVLISKVIQNIANMQPPGKKEEYMVALSDFIVQSIPKIIKFYDNLRMAVNLEESSNEDELNLTVPEEVKQNGLAATANFLHTDTNKIREWLAPEECPLDHLSKAELETILDECKEQYTHAPKKLKSATGAEGATSATAELSKKKKKSK